MKSQIVVVLSERGSRFVIAFSFTFWIGLASTGCNAERDRLIAHPSLALETEIRTFCGACHVVPLPEMFPQSMWYSEVRRGYEFYFESSRQDLDIPILADVVEYYRERAPLKLEFPDSKSSTPSPIVFRVQSFVLNAATSKPGISFAAWTEKTRDRGRLRISDMGSGEIGFFEPSTSSFNPLTNSSSNPAATCICDLDGDGNLDLAIADLGSFLPEDHRLGKVIWVSDVLREGREISTTILENIGRVSDVRAADFDGDGDEDLVVAEFGWHRTGGIHLIWNEGKDTATGKLRFRSEKIDPRPGAIHVPPVDLNGDGRIDFVALFSQEFEVVVAFLNLPQGFEKVTIFAALDPSFGSSGIELIDFDRDGDLDVLYTNGDTFDSSLLKPFHSIKWFENEGTFPFKVHQVAEMPGVHRARAADLDSDGDFDIVAAAMVPKKLLRTAANGSLDALVWFEQTERDTFERHVLSTGSPEHTTIEIADLDDDGDVDLAVGCFQFEADEKSPAMLVFWNEGPIRP